MVFRSLKFSCGSFAAFLSRTIVAVWFDTLDIFVYFLVVRKVFWDFLNPERNFLNLGRVEFGVRERVSGLLGCRFWGYGCGEMGVLENVLLINLHEMD